MARQKSNEMYKIKDVKSQILSLKIGSVQIVHDKKFFIEIRELLNKNHDQKLIIQTLLTIIEKYQQHLNCQDMIQIMMQQFIQRCCVEKKFVNLYFSLLKDCIKGQLCKKLQIKKETIISMIDQQFQQVVINEKYENTDIFQVADQHQPDFINLYKNQITSLIGLLSEEGGAIFKDYAIKSNEQLVKKPDLFKYSINISLYIPYDKLQIVKQKFTEYQNQKLLDGFTVFKYEELMNKRNAQEDINIEILDYPEQTKNKKVSKQINLRFQQNSVYKSEYFDTKFNEESDQPNEPESINNDAVPELYQQLIDKIDIEQIEEELKDSSILSILQIALDIKSCTGIKKLVLNQLSQAQKQPFKLIQQIVQNFIIEDKIQVIKTKINQFFVDLQFTLYEQQRILTTILENIFKNEIIFQNEFILKSFIYFVGEYVYTKRIMFSNIFNVCIDYLKSNNTTNIQSIIQLFIKQTITKLVLISLDNQYKELQLDENKVIAMEQLQIFFQQRIFYFHQIGLISQLNFDTQFINALQQDQFLYFESNIKNYENILNNFEFESIANITDIVHNDSQFIATILNFYPDYNKMMSFLEELGYIQKFCDKELESKYLINCFINIEKIQAEDLIPLNQQNFKVQQILIQKLIQNQKLIEKYKTSKLNLIKQQVISEIKRQTTDNKEVELMLDQFKCVIQK